MYTHCLRHLRPDKSPQMLHSSKGTFCILDATCSELTAANLTPGVGGLSFIVNGCQQDVLRLEVCVDELQAVQVGHTLQQLLAKVPNHINLEGMVLVDTQEVIQTEPNFSTHLQDSWQP